MAWSTTDWTPGNIQQYADEFWKAIKERRQAVGESANLVPITGANIQTGGDAAPTSTTGKFGWRYLQNQIESLCTPPEFVRSHNDNGTARATDYYDGLATIEMWTFDNLMKAVRGGTAQSSFRRATTYPTDWTNWADANYSTGKITLGTPRDIFGPWILTDIQKALNMLVWTSPSVSWNITGNNYRWGNGFCDEYAGPFPCSWAAMKAAAEADWPNNTDAQAGHEPCAYSHGWKQDTPPAILWRAYLRRWKNKLTGTGLWTGCKRAIDYYVHATKFLDTFNAHGDDVLEDLWSLWETHTPDPPTAGFTSPTALGKIGVGDDPLPPWCNEPVDMTGTGVGWELTSPGANKATIVRWNVTGGFVYV